MVDHVVSICLNYINVMIKDQIWQGRKVLELVFEEFLEERVHQVVKSKIGELES